MTDKETYRGVVYPWHCDFNDHMNVQHYMGRFDEATWHFLASLGITPSYRKKENRILVAAEQTIKYMEELHAGDLIYIKSSLVESRSKAIVMLHRMFNGETNNLVAEAKMAGVHLDRTTRRAVAFPEEIMKGIKSSEKIKSTEG